MNAAQALLRQVRRTGTAWLFLDPDLIAAIDEELERAETTAPTPEPPADRTDPTPAEDLAKRLAPTARDLAYSSTLSFDESLESLMRAAGFVPAREGPLLPRDAYRSWDRVAVLSEARAASLVAGYVDPAVMNDALVDDYAPRPRIHDPGPGVA